MCLGIYFPLQIQLCNQGHLYLTRIHQHPPRLLMFWFHMLAKDVEYMEHYCKFHWFNDWLIYGA